MDGHISKRACRKNHNTKIGNKSFGSVKEFGYVVATQTNLNSIHKRAD
jgi:hypothetical protein